MQALIDFSPLIAFFVSYRIAGIYVATGVLIAACALQIGYHWLRFRKVKPLHWIMGGLVLLFGSATLILHDPKFIQVKTTVLMWLLGAAFLVSQFVGRKPLSQRFLESMLESVEGLPQGALSRAPWAWINLGWVAFFGVVGCINLYIVHHFSESTWVNFKVGGLALLLLLFLTPQIIWLMPKENKQ